MLSLADLGAAMPLQELLESEGHKVTWNARGAAGPTDVAAQVDLVMLDAEDPGCVEATEKWRDHDPPPGVLLVGRSDAAKGRSTQARANLVANGAATDVIAKEIDNTFTMRFAGRMSGPYARAVLKLGPAQDARSDAARIVAAARDVDVDLVRECLRWRAYQYVCATPLVAAMREDRALTIPEIEVTRHLDGTHTVQKLVSAKGADGVMIGRLLWALISADAARCTEGPPDERTPARKAITLVRRHLLARRDRLANATHYDVLEVTRDANSRLVDYAARILALRFAPDRLASLDLGEVSFLVASNWQQVLVARQVLMDDANRAKYDDAIDARKAQLTSPWAFEVPDPSVAEEFFRRGQAALVAGEASKAVSGIAGACRNHPDHPNYEAYLCWARFRSEVDRGGDREKLVIKERQTAELALVGRRPWPLALVALAMLCAADNDPDSARYHLAEALRVDPNLPLAKQLMGRLGASQVS